ncbi:hypothetical protein [Acinetobacter guerrae]|uniref:hypothetical protein n=1 Tax=Acinetobacter guerrae TaxID=1843371 RepID=UPI00125FC500|nr:hypothetical protein [Acinetobacter guerrae]
MTAITYTVNFKKTVLASVIGLFLSQSCFALQEISDESLSETTGEGIALLPENFSMRLNGPDDSGMGANGAGSIRLIPVGPVSTAMQAKGYQKADIFINGISLAQSKKDYGVGRTADDWGTPFGNIGTGSTGPDDFGRQITSWGSANNPWIFKTVTANVPDFVGQSKDVAYLTFEAPLMHTAIPTTGAESSAYNLKLGLWVDAFMRDSGIAENVTNDLYAGLNKDNRLRLAVVWDGFSINGSNLKVFRTLDGVTSNMGGQYTANLKINNVITPKTFNYGLNTSYNATFGLAGVVRLNSGYTNGADARGSVGFGTTTRNIYQLDYSRNADNSVKRDAAGNVIYTQGADVTSNPNTSAGILQTYTPPTNTQKTTTYDGLPPAANGKAAGSFPNGGMCSSAAANTYDRSANENGGSCHYQEGVTARRFVASSTNTWTMPAVKSVLRISTQELGLGDSGTPALGGAVSNFKTNSNEGIYLYNPNINLVLGSLSQPLIFNTDGSNFSFELTRIPNKVEVYSKIYQRYADIDPATGTNAVDSSINYMGNTCNVHKCGGNITIGGVTYQDSKATHSSITIGSTVYDAATNRLTAYKGIEAFGVSIGALQSQSGLVSSNTVDYSQVWQQVREGNRTGNWLTGYNYSWQSWGGWTAVAPKGATANNPDPYETTYRQNTNGQILGIQTTMPTNISSTLSNMSAPGATPSNNFGSAAIDGVLIQHFKFTTTGL